MKIVVIKYNAGNIGSVVNALERLGYSAEVTDDPVRIRRASKVIFPGVGEASSTMAYLKARELGELITSLTQPVLGICLGMQLMCRSSEEGDVAGLGIFSEEVKRFQGELKVPHMGWNSISFATDEPLFRKIDPGSYVYFVHSFFAATGDNTVAVCEYELPFSAALQRDNFFAVQFHPEKSGEIGLQLIKNFLEL
ncbi:MAG: imidazole glycerol phosphate synthase subunit HisH [Bacteroidales bacterium]|jgi:glutamine amidotransferase|nr:imidazole glycerol phosphate synthase subunit HisH [Bacteroidales bacterium]MDD3385130.1 imidazole glycerol phosphate synthase subunit HisH [Bacteroidales bacterium]MDD3872027.1 imidazole glycerol phosphate synthase subunit HisH [Bacteroidales bacterium]